MFQNKFSCGVRVGLCGWFFSFRMRYLLQRLGSFTSGAISAFRTRMPIGRRFQSSYAYTSSESSSQVVKHVGFALGFTVCAFGTALVVDHYRRQRTPDRERWRKIQAALRDMGVEIGPGSRSNGIFWRKVQEGHPIDALKEQWQSMRASKKTIAAIIGLNTLVFIAWRVRPASAFMRKYFVHSPGSPPSALLGSMVSHISVLHYGFNMFALWSFGHVVHEFLDREQFLAMYASAGVIASLCSHLLRRRASYASLGASGALYALMGALAAQRPEAQVGIVFLPWSASVGTFLPVLLVVEAAALGLFRSPLDHIAHISGALCGYAYMQWGRPLWLKRDQYWAQLMGRRGDA